MVFANKNTNMGWLEVTFKIGLAHPLMAMHAASSPTRVRYSDTHNTVLIEPPTATPNTEARLEKIIFGERQMGDMLF